MVVPSLLLDLMVKVKKLTFFSAAMQEMKHQGFDFERHLYLEEDTFNAKKNGKDFFPTFIKFAIQSAVLLTVSAVLSFYFSLRVKNVRTSKILGNISPTLHREEKVPMFSPQENCSN